MSSSGSGCSISRRSNASSPARCRRVVERVRGVRVDLRAGSSPNRSRTARTGSTSSARLDLQLDAPVALVEVAARRRRGAPDDVVVIPTDTPQSTAVPHRAEEARRTTCRSPAARRRGSPSRPPPSPSGGPRPVAGSARPRAATSPCSEQARQQVPADDVVRAVDVLGRVERLADMATHSPQPSPSAVDDVHEQHVALALRAERRPERRDERHPQPEELDRLESSSREEEPAVARDRLGPVAVAESDRPTVSRTACRHACALSGLLLAHADDVLRDPGEQRAVAAGTRDRGLAVRRPGRRMTRPVASRRLRRACHRRPGIERSEVRSQRMTTRSLSSPAFSRSRSGP